MIDNEIPYHGYVQRKTCKCGSVFYIENETLQDRTQCFSCDTVDRLEIELANVRKELDELRGSLIITNSSMPDNPTFTRDIFGTGN